MKSMLPWQVATTISFAADLITTGYAFRLGAVETNPLMRGWDFWQIAAAKIVVLSAVLATARLGKMAKIVHGYGATATGAVAIWNGYAIAAFVWGVGA